MDDVKDVRPQWGLRIPLRDGVHLAANAYLPKETVSAPCVFALTPYIADLHHERAMYFARRGLAFVAVDVRGRGNSEGTFVPSLQEAKDGYDVVEWLARQPFCNGKVAMWGSSYLGYSQWATAKEAPEHLATIIPIAASYKGVDFPMRNNIFNPYVMQWVMLTSGRTPQMKIFSDAELWAGRFRAWFESGRPFCEVDSMVGQPSAIFQEWLKHPHPDEYWDEYNPTADQLARMRIPILTVTGAYDDDQPGSLEHYKQHMRYAPVEARAQHYLVIGPWDHLGTATPRNECGGVKFGPASLVDMLKLQREWYAFVMEGAPRPAFLRKRVAYYVMGAEHWRYADTLESVTAHRRPFYLDSTRGASDLFASGSLSSVKGSGPPDSYTYDPRDGVGPEIEAEEKATVGSLIDQSVLLALRGKQLVYHTEPFHDNVEISGFFELSAWIALDCPDTDLYASVYEVLADGSSIRLSTDGMRARYREGLRTPKLIQTREPLHYNFNRFTFVSREIKRGSRLRLVVAPIGRLIETTFAEKNFNRGGAVAYESAREGRAVTVKLFHDAQHPSVLSVPIGHAVSAQEPTAPETAFSVPRNASH